MTVRCPGDNELNGFSSRCLKILATHNKVVCSAHLHRTPGSFLQLCLFPHYFCSRSFGSFGLSGPVVASPRPCWIVGRDCIGVVGTPGKLRTPEPCSGPPPSNRGHSRADRVQCSPD